MGDLRDRLARLMANAVPFGTCRGGWSLLGRYERKQWQRVADAILASEEWQAREAVVEAFEKIMPSVFMLEERIGGPWFEVWTREARAALARLVAVRGRT